MIRIISIILLLTLSPFSAWGNRKQKIEISYDNKILKFHSRNDTTQVIPQYINASLDEMKNLTKTEVAKQINYTRLRIENSSIINYLYNKNSVIKYLCYNNFCKIINLKWKKIRKRKNFYSIYKINFSKNIGKYIALKLLLGRR